MSRTYLVLILAGFLLFSPLFLGAQNNGSGFDKFYSEFKAAVTRKDADALGKMMAERFDFFQAENVAPETVFKQLDAENGKQWANLQLAVKASPVEFSDGYMGEPARAVQCRATSDAYHCYVIFTQDSEKQWRWRAMIMPDRVHRLRRPAAGTKPKK